LNETVAPDVELRTRSAVRDHPLRTTMPSNAPLLPVLLAAVAVAVPHVASAKRVEAASPGPGWEEANRSDELIIYAKENKEAGVREIRAFAEMDFTPEQVFQVLFKLEEYAQFMPYTLESKLVEKLGENEVISYQRLSPPLVDQRDYYIKVKVTKAATPTGTFKTEWTAVPDHAAEVKGVVRVRLNTGSWTFEPLDGGKRTRVTYSLLTHPGGSIPGWLANQSNTIAIPDLFKAVRKRAGGGK